MISIVLYGRNDSYGYNLHKRAALSLNCMAEVLTDPSDEILFVDYNTPDDFPTFPEAIQDTLTKRARGLLRILRVRPRLHERFKSKTHLVALEPVARNVAIRRSEPSNRWILSTNTDMIFVPRGGGSLSELAGQLAPGFYHAPRIEIPEVLWESFDRGAPAAIIDTVREWGSTLHLNEIILGSNYILYDGPGDFQLLLRSDLFENQGFHEEMLLGWHVDSNMAKRMYVKYGTVGDLGKQVYGYHCDHTRQVTPAHSHTRLQNNWRIFCEQVERPDIPELADTWGCVNDTIEEVRLVANPASVYVQGLREAIGGPLAEAPVVKYTHETYNKISYDPRHVLPFLADMFVSMPRSSNLAWYGAGVEMLTRFAAVWEKLGFSGKVLADRDLVQRNDLAAAVGYVSGADLLDAADAFVFDFGDLPGSPHETGGSARKQLSDELLRRFQRVVRAERRRLAEGLPPRRVIALNAINNEYERVITAHVAAAATPCATHMRHGYVLPIKAKDDWLPLLDVGQAGIRVGDRAINSNPRKLGFITYGPCKYLDEGRYRVAIEIEVSAIERDRPHNEQCVVVEVWSGPELLGIHLIRRQTLRRPNHEFCFDVSALATDEIRGVEIRTRLLARIALSIRSVTVEPVPASSNRTDDGGSSVALPLALKIKDWLPYLFVGKLGDTEETGVSARKGRPDYVVFGPYWPLPAGRYQLTVKFEMLGKHNDASHGLRVDVTAASGARALVSANFSSNLLPRDEDLHILHLPFSVRSAKSEQRLIETRIWSSGHVQFRIRSVSVTPSVERGPEDIYPLLLAGEVGTRRAGKLQSIGKRAGFAAYSQTIEVEPGHYRLTFRVAISGNELVFRARPYATASVKQGFDVLAVTALRLEGQQSAEQELEFDVRSDSDAAEIEFFFHVVGTASIVLSSLVLDPLGPVTQQPDSAVCRLQDWVPFLQMKRRARADGDGIVVSKGRDDFVIYGPFWTLPAGHYEMIASIVPDLSSSDTNAVITGDISAAGGMPLFAVGKWRLRQYQLADADASIEFRLPFTLADDLPPESRAIETRIFSPGNASFRLRSLAVRVRSDELEHDWFLYLTVGECGFHTGREIESSGDKPGYIASTAPMAIRPGHYEAFLDIGTFAAGSADRSPLALEVWSGQDLVAFVALKPEDDQLLEFDVTEEIAKRGIELRIRAIIPSPVSIRGLKVERTSETVTPDPMPAVLRLQDWLPFLRMRPRAHADADGIVVSEGRDDFAVYGPFWTLPAGHYEMIASIVPHLSSRENNPLITAQVTGEEGKRIFAAGELHLGQVQCGDGKAVEIRVPFTLADDLPPESRAIETRIFSPGNASFRIRSLAVRVRSDELEHDWFLYLTVGECGFHTGREIESSGDKPGYIASTAPMAIRPGHYEAFLDIGTFAAGSADRSPLALEVWSGQDLVAFVALKPEDDQLLEFDVTEEITKRGIELRIRAIIPSPVSIRGLKVERTSETVTLDPMPAVLRLQDWLPFLRMRPRAHADADGIVVSEGRDDFAVYGPFWTLPAGHYEMIASIVPHLSSRENNPLITAQVTGEEGKRIFAAGELHLGQVQCGDGKAVEIRVPFTLADDLPPESRAIETRIFSPGNASFRIQSMTVRMINDELRLLRRLKSLPKLCVRTYALAVRKLKAFQANDRGPKIR